MASHDPLDEDDALPPLLYFDGENNAFASGVGRGTAKLRRASTGLASQGFQPTPLRRASTRKFSSSSMEDLLPPRFQPGEAKKDGEDDYEQHSSSGSKLLAFFAVPVVAGLMFENGARITTDLILVALACLFLYWSIELPWQWYWYARTLAVEDPARRISVAISESSDGLEIDPQDGDKPKLEKIPSTEKMEGEEPDRRRPQEWQTLHSYELRALALCFVAPPATAYLLHHIRVYLSRPQDSPIENASFILFVLAAELIPLNHACKLLFSHTLYLQRVVASYDVLEDDKVKDLKTTVEQREGEHKREIEEMARSIAELQARLLHAQHPSPPSESSRTPPPGQEGKSVANSTQTQVDALNRAVRRYEKRAITQAMMTEARLRDLEARISDALTLAAAATRSTQSSSLFAKTLETAAWLFSLPLRLLRALFAWPVSALNDLYRFLLGPRRRKKRKGESRERTAGSAGEQVRGRYRLEKR